MKSKLKPVKQTDRKLYTTKPKMMVYEFITPSEPITFLAPNDKVAFAVAIIVGNGKAGCKNTDTNESLNTILLFCTNPNEALNKEVGSNFEQFIKRHIGSIKNSLNSFAYGNARDRETYDSAIAAITDAEKLVEFKTQYEDRNRTSMSEWVKRAWRLAEIIK